MKTKKIIIWVVVIAILGLGINSIAKASKKPGLYDDLATCLKDSGALFYGAFWCPHCMEQKQLFGRKSSKLLPYVECSTPDGKGQLPICTEKEITGYPTWIFADGTRTSGKVTPADLANKTSCPLPTE
jgi:thiol-disulfide isomerase/thioredoxin